MAREQRNHNMEIAKNLILKVFRFLEDQYLLTSCYKVENDPTFIEYLNVEYVDEIKRRKIRIGYTKGEVYNEIKYTFSSSITRIPYSGVEDYFSLSQYLQSIGKDFSTSLVNHFDETEAQNILVQIVTALKEHALDIIDGKKWLESYYPRKD